MEDPYSVCQVEGRDLCDPIMVAYSRALVGRELELECIDLDPKIYTPTVMRAILTRLARIQHHSEETYIRRISDLEKLLMEADPSWKRI